MKKMFLVTVVAVLMSGTSAFAADDVYSGGKAVVKGTEKVIVHVSVDTFKVSKAVAKDVYGTGKYIVTGAVKGIVHVGSELKHAFKK